MQSWDCGASEAMGKAGGVEIVDPTVRSRFTASKKQSRCHPESGPADRVAGGFPAALSSEWLK